MSDDITGFERITRAMPNHYGEAWSAERTKENFYLYSHSKRAEALDLIDDHMSRTEPSSLREYARLSKLRRELAATHSTLMKAGR
jgi:hypothetical protein